MVYFSLFSDGGHDDGLGDLFGSSSWTPAWSSASVTPKQQQPSQLLSFEPSQDTSKKEPWWESLSVDDIFSVSSPWETSFSPQISPLETKLVSEKAETQAASSFGWFSFSPPSEDSSPVASAQSVDIAVVWDGQESNLSSVSPDLSQVSLSVEEVPVNTSSLVNDHSETIFPVFPAEQPVQEDVSAVENAATVWWKVSQESVWWDVNLSSSHETIAETQPVIVQPVTRDGVVVPDLPPLHQHSPSSVAEDVVISSAPKKKQEASVTTLDDVATNAERKPDVKQTVSSRKRVGVWVLLAGCIGFVF